MLKNLSKESLLTLILNPLTAGSSDPNSSVVDMQEYDSCLFVGILGTQCSTGIAKSTISASASTGSTTFSDLSGVTVSSSAGSSDKLLLIDLAYPGVRYLRSTLTRSSTSCEFGGLVGIRYGKRNRPVVQSGLAATEVLAVCPTT